MPNLVELMKTAAMDAYKASAPCMVITGRVIKTDPIEIKVDPKITLGEQQLIMSATVSGNLAVDDEVIMIRQMGGQQFFVMDWKG